MALGADVLLSTWAVNGRTSMAIYSRYFSWQQLSANGHCARHLFASRHSGGDLMIIVIAVKTGTNWMQALVVCAAYACVLSTVHMNLCYVYACC